MRVELPACARCCFCLPLRRGLLALAYLHLVGAALLLCVDGLRAWAHGALGGAWCALRGADFSAPLWLCAPLHALDLLAYAALIFAAHTRRARWVAWWLAYGAATLAAALAAWLAETLASLRAARRHLFLALENGAFVFCGVVVYVYLWLLARSLLRRLRGPPLAATPHRAADDPHTELIEVSLPQ